MLTVVGQQQITIGLNTEAIEEWIDYRKEKKKPLTERALAKSRKFLLRYPPEIQQWLVDSAIMNDWVGLHHVDPPKNQAPRNNYNDIPDLMEQL